MTKILRIINRFNLGGPTYNTVFLSKFISKEFETLLIGGEKDDSEESSLFIAEQYGLRPTIVAEMKRSINPLNDYFAYKKIKKIIKEYKPDIVHTHASKAGTIGRLAAISCKVPVIVHTFHGHVFHSYFGSFKTSIYKNIERYLAKKSSAIIAISEKQKQELTLDHKICDANKMHVIPLGFDLDKFQENIEGKRKSFRNQYHIKDDEIAITIIGRLVPIKNHKLFLEAFKKTLNKSTQKLKAVIVGDGEERKNIESIASDLGIDFSDGSKNSTLIFTSWRKDIDVVCAGSDIITLTSFNEGTPVSLIEAQAGNKPIVTTNVGGIQNVIMPDETGFLINTFSPDDFSKAILKLTENRELRLQMGSKGWDHVKNNYHYTRLVKDIESLYKKLLSGSKSSN